MENKKLIKLSELNPKNFPTTPTIDANLQELLEKLNKIRAEYKVPMIITSGLRSMEDHLRIYAEKNKKLKDAGENEIKVPLGSNHLYGLAADISDKDGQFWNWIQTQTQLIEDLDLYFEAKSASPTWTHVQIRAPKSNKRIFNP